MDIFIRKVQLLNHNILAKRALLRQLMVFTVFVMLCFVSSSAVYSVVPAVMNLSIQDESEVIVIRYDLAYSEAGTISIGLECSHNTGNIYNIIPNSVTGDIGNVSPGTGKQINWNIVSDLPGAHLNDIKIRMIANDGTHTIRYITKGGAVMVLIPEGNFQMGSLPTSDGMPIFGDEVPKHTVYVNSFYMDAHEVTNAQYAQFLSATGHTSPSYWGDEKFNALDQPVVGVTWDVAVAYCLWAEKRLPMEAEWERAARSGLGNEFPWGNTLDHNYGNFASIEGSDEWYDTAPVCSFMPNEYGLFDMIGNVYEWCMDYYDYFYYKDSPESNPLGPEFDPESIQNRVLRGGSCYDGFFPTYLRSATRYSYQPSTSNGIVGFRCVMNNE
ncbi:MAG: Formylglycine-rating enzyme family protein [Candidatus Poribacteria bacterium]|nr:Formylglycine-rating enzyme family protein [Candidatus Poribacteria bacterium]